MEVAAHAGEVGDDVDAQGAELVGRADAGGEQQAGEPMVPPETTTSPSA